MNIFIALCGRASKEHQYNIFDIALFTMQYQISTYVCVNMFFSIIGFIIDTITVSTLHIHSITPC